MSVKIADVGEWRATDEIPVRPQKMVLPLSDGRVLFIVPEGNNATAFGINSANGNGTGTDTIKVYRAAADMTGITLVATVTTGTLETAHNLISGDLFDDDSLALVWRRSSGAVCYVKVTNTAGTYSVGTVEVVTTPTNSVYNLDVTVSEGGVPAFGMTLSAATNPKGILRIFVRNTSNVWVQATDTNLLTTNDPVTQMFSLSIQWVKGGTAGARNLVVAAHSAQLGGTDLGVRVYSAIVVESTGVLSNMTLRQTYMAGNMGVGWGSMVRRVYLFRTATNEIVLAGMESADKQNIYIARLSWNGTTWTELMPPQTSTADHLNIEKSYRMAASYANYSVNFYYMSSFQGSPITPLNYVGDIDTTLNSVRWGGPYRWDNSENLQNDRWYPMAGTGKRAETAAGHYMIFVAEQGNGLISIRGHRSEPALAPVFVTPVSGGTATNQPDLKIKARIGKQYPQSKHKAVFQIASDVGFTTNLKTYTQPDTSFVKIENTQNATSYYIISDTLPSTLALTSGTWYIRAALVDEFGVTGAYSTPFSFTVSHPPAAANLSPNSGQSFTTGAVQFTWDFTDPWIGDTQSAFQIIVENNDTGAVILDTGKQTSTNKSYLGNITSTYEGLMLRWKIRLWDADNVAGAYSDYETFQIAAAPTVVINSPTNAQVVASGTPQILFTPTVGNGRTIKKYQVTLSSGGSVIRDSGVISTDSPSGTQLSWRPTEIIPDLTSLTADVTVGDSMGMIGTATRNFSVDFTEPATSSGLAASASSYNVDGSGYVNVTWNDTNRDTANFEAWIVYRRDDLLGTDGITVVATGTWTEIARVTATGASYSYKDYKAPSGYKVNYKVEQLINNAGSRTVSSTSSTVNASPASDGYWLFSADGVTAFRLHNVSEDSYTPEWEEQSYTVIGRGRHVDRGDYLGPAGSLTAQLRNTGTTSARQKKLQLEAARNLSTPLYLRTPFGDVWYVVIGNLNISRIAGVANQEFVDVTVPYSQVMA